MKKIFIKKNDSWEAINVEDVKNLIQEDKNYSIFLKIDGEGEVEISQRRKIKIGSSSYELPIEGASEKVLQIAELLEIKILSAQEWVDKINAEEVRLEKLYEQELVEWNKWVENNPFEKWIVGKVCHHEGVSLKDIYMCLRPRLVRPPKRWYNELTVAQSREGDLF